MTGHTLIPSFRQPPAQFAAAMREPVPQPDLAAHAEDLRCGTLPPELVKRPPKDERRKAENLGLRWPPAELTLDTMPTRGSIAALSNSREARAEALAIHQRTKLARFEGKSISSQLISDIVATMAEAEREWMERFNVLMLAHLTDIASNRSA